MSTRTSQNRPREPGSCFNGEAFRQLAAAGAAHGGFRRQAAEGQPEQRHGFDAGRQSVANGGGLAAALEVRAPAEFRWVARGKG